MDRRLSPRPKFFFGGVATNEDCYYDKKSSDYKNETMYGNKTAS